MAQTLSAVSVVIPAYNEAGSIQELVTRIHTVLSQISLTYEIIIIDDHSDDGTPQIATQLAATYPIKLLSKKGKRGKAQSVLQGFAEAAHDVIVMIDGDLQYPPEAIPHLLLPLINDQADIVVANRKEQQISKARQLFNQCFWSVFGKKLHGLEVDIQSGLKVFRTEIIHRLQLRPSQWTFDMEFLIKAKSAGYHLASVDIVFLDRTTGKSKVGLFRSAFEIGWSAVKLKFLKHEAIPFSIKHAERVGKGFHFRGKRYVHHTKLHDSESAFTNLTFSQRSMLLGVIALIVAGLVINPHFTLITVFATLTTLYFIDLLFYMFLVVAGSIKQPEIAVSDEEIALHDQNWPKYTIFCPLYKEWSVVPQFIAATSAMDYPKDKLQVMLLLESDDQTTIDMINQFDLPDFFQVVVVPDSQPKTKPKACNYGLTKATGEFVVIYDAEDIPDPLQLKKAVIAFERSHSKTICMQAKLNFYNPHQNLLTRVFTAEYSLWFDLILTGLQSIHAPIPLGGTSNHFRTAELKHIEGWDSFNVTEDCDLGIRLAKRGYRTALIHSTTLEEANSDLKNWFWQRTRWIKGYFQTYFVHMRNPDTFGERARKSDFPMFQLIVGGKVLLALINPLMWIVTALYFLARSRFGAGIEALFPASVLYMGVFSLIVGNFLYLYYYMIGCARRGQHELIKFAYLVPIYWLMMSAAAWVAFIQLFYQPHHWSKTKHGLHLVKVKPAKPASPAVRMSPVSLTASY